MVTIGCSKTDLTLTSIIQTANTGPCYLLPYITGNVSIRVTTRSTVKGNTVTFSDLLITTSNCIWNNIRNRR
ncbi:hypothetical protein BOW37_04325 [Solemya velum gill symbiont]|nr:hypothetical protein BOW37_04325 [Solemya velum gill symbiont]OOZ52699.1 hypothetical protein BOW40_00890 [Solemya velum gill symbiont]OOZ55906.1 hypothetical protein BOW41_00895 [Solemya velum gill symbiont]